MRDIFYCIYTPVYFITYISFSSPISYPLYTHIFITHISFLSPISHNPYIRRLYYTLLKNIISQIAPHHLNYTMLHGGKIYPLVSTVLIRPRYHNPIPCLRPHYYYVHHLQPYSSPVYSSSHHTRNTPTTVSDHSSADQRAKIPPYKPNHN